MNRDDELLTVFPETLHHRGRFAGYNSGSRVRRSLLAISAIGAAVALGAFVRHLEDLEHKRLHPLEEVEKLLASDSPRSMTWRSGKARLPMAAEAPAINLIHLPDRDLRLAPGCDRAQVKIEVRDGRTVSVRAIIGKIIETKPGSSVLIPRAQALDPRRSES